MCRIIYLLFLTYILLSCNSYKNPKLPEYNWINSELGYLVSNQDGYFFITYKKATIDEIVKSTFNENLNNKKLKTDKINLRGSLDDYALHIYIAENKDKQVQFNYGCIKEFSYVIPVYITYIKNYEGKSNRYQEYCLDEKRKHKKTGYKRIIEVKPLENLVKKEVGKIRDTLNQNSKSYQDWINQN